MELKVWCVNASRQHLWKLAFRGGGSNEVHVLVDVYPRDVCFPVVDKTCIHVNCAS